MEEHKKHQQIVLQTLQDHQLYVKYRKCEFYEDQIQYLRHVISQEGIVVDLERIKTILEWQVPQNLVDIRSFLGFVVSYHHFIKGFSRVAYRLTSLQKRGKAFEWTSKCENNFDHLRHCLSTTLISRIYNPQK